MSALQIGSHSIRRENEGDKDREMWCLTDLWRAAGAPAGIRPANWLRKEGAAFVEFLRDSSTMPYGHTRQKAGNPSKGEPPTTWGYWQIALAYAKALSPEFHARVNEVYRAFMSGQLVPVGQSAAELELVRLSLRLAPAPTKSPWTVRVKEELARLYGIKWVAGMPEPRALRSAYGYTWRIILGDAVYSELKRRNPYPKKKSLHAEWLQEQRMIHARERDFAATEALIQRAATWEEFVHDMRAFFRRQPLQLVMTSRFDVRRLRSAS